MANTFLTYKVTINNDSSATNFDKTKSSLRQIAEAICNTAETGWSADEKYIDPITNKPTLKSENDYYVINLNHTSGSVLRFTMKTALRAYCGFFPSASDINYNKCWSNTGTSTTQDAPAMVLINSYLPTLASDSFDLYISIDTRGNGVCFYYTNNSAIQTTLLGNFIHNFCYPSAISSPCDSNFFMAYAEGLLTMKYFYQNEWRTATYNDAKINPVLGITSTQTNKVILSPVMLGDSNNKPYGYVDSCCLNYINKIIRQGAILDSGNYIVGIVEQHPTFLPIRISYALGWSPLNTKEVNPWYTE